MTHTRPSLRDHGLSDQQWRVLRVLGEHAEEADGIETGRVAREAFLLGPSLTGVLARMERDGLVAVEGDRHLELSADGRTMATRVMRKHRLAECLLVEVIGLPWEDVHAEACRWEHVMSENVERRILEILGHPTVSPYGNPIPGLAELDEAATFSDLTGLTTLDKVVGEASTRVTVVRIGEPIQNDAALMRSMRRAGALPGATVTVFASPGGVLVGSAGEYAELDSVTASHVFVSKG